MFGGGKLEKEQGGVNDCREAKSAPDVADCGRPGVVEVVRSFWWFAWHNRIVFPYRMISG